ncbi:hypothetical protein [Chitinimonas sp. BJB300]|nr:hypothetical protein [Chitinimonas sp. BJB300]
MANGHVVSRTIVKRYPGGFTVVEGDVMTDQDGARVSLLTGL